MKPIGISELLLYNTIRLETSNGAGTGFFFQYKFDESIVPVIVTNKHVVNNNPNETVRFLLHLGDDQGNDFEENYDVTFTTNWLFHGTQDICITFANPLFEEVRKRTGKSVFYSGIGEDIIYSKDKLKELSAIESVTMVGYPTGLWDAMHNYPIFRNGYTASHPGYDFNQISTGLVDMACFPGSSGSPVFILNENGYSDKLGNTYLSGRRVIFLGVLHSGPVMNVNGEIVVVDIPTQQKAITQSQTMINLGYYCKAYELLEFKDKIGKMIGQGGNGE